MSELGYTKLRGSARVRTDLGIGERGEWARDVIGRCMKRLQMLLDLRS